MSLRPNWLKKIDQRYSTDHNKDIQRWLNLVVAEINNPYTSQDTCLQIKKELFEFIWLLGDIYEDLPNFGEDEVEWEKQRLYNKLKKRNNK
jgi:hypothetical protein